MTVGELRAWVEALRDVPEDAPVRFEDFHTGESLTAVEWYVYAGHNRVVIELAKEVTV